MFNKCIDLKLKETYFEQCDAMNVRNYKKDIRNFIAREVK